MEKQEIRALARELHETVPGNRLSAGEGIRPDCVGLQFFDAPLIGFGAADDPLFAAFQSPEAVGPWYMRPEEWLAGARSVISLFFPISAPIRAANARETAQASLEWCYARIEGQDYIGAFMAAMAKRLGERGAACCIPQYDPRWEVIRAGKGIEGYEEIVRPTTFSSRWSERHAAYVCGLGTFGLSKGLITERGIAGRFASIVTDLSIEADARPYAGLYDYCIRCGACARRCPVGAIDPETGKRHLPCSAHVGKSKVIFAPRYGCSLCQTAVPCEDRNPARG